MSFAIEARNVTKEYSSTVAIDNITISWEKDKIYGLLGRNGAGKTTLMHLLAGQLLPTTGTIEVMGEEVYENSKALNQICYVGSFANQNINYVKTFKVKDFLTSAALFFPNWDEDFAKQLVELFSLDLKKPFKDLSTGMHSMISIIISLASRAPVTLLDEPYSGLDAAARQEFYDILAEEYSNNPRTIIFSTHLIDEATNLFQEVVLLHQGKVLLSEPLETIQEASFIVSGDRDTVKSMVVNKRVINQQVLGGRASYALFTPLTEQERQEYVQAGLELRHLSLQQLFVHLTANKGGNT